MHWFEYNQAVLKYSVFWTDAMRGGVSWLNPEDQLIGAMKQDILKHSRFTWSSAVELSENMNYMEKMMLMMTMMMMVMMVMILVVILVVMMMI